MSQVKVTKAVKQPRCGQRIETGRYGTVRVLQVFQFGIKLRVIDRLEREWEIERAERGWWTRVDQGGEDV